MKTRVVSDSDIILHRARGYISVNGELKNPPWISSLLNTTADGSLYLTAHDFALWDMALDGEKPLSVAMKNNLWSPAKLNDGTLYPYGLGWHLSSFRGHKVVEHGGGWQGFKGYFSRFIDDKFAVIVLTNVSTSDAQKIAHNIQRISADSNN